MAPAFSLLWESRVNGKVCCIKTNSLLLIGHVQETEEN